ncbi:MAG: class I SAM-dependent methyltransferase [Chloroflexota bacterium]
MSEAQTADASLNRDERALLRVALDLGAAEVGGPLTEAEQRLADQARTPFQLPAPSLQDTRDAILAGDDPLGTRLCEIRPPARRRHQGAIYTPASLVGPMLDWVLERNPDRLVDPGCGSGRFAAGAIRHRSDLPVVAVDLDPFATLLTRANLGVLGARSARVIQADYTTFDLPRITGRTAFVGNPPYVRHHDLSAGAKAWVVAAGRRLGYTVSTLAGLHVYFYLATALNARPGDVGCFVTSAEWLDVNYGTIVRRLFVDGLGGQSLHLVNPRAVPFADAMTTAVIAGFVVGTPSERVHLRFVAAPSDLGDLNDGREVDRARLGSVQRWTQMITDRSRDDPGEPFVPLDKIARVHRGIVTGANDFFILTRESAGELGLLAWCRPAITHAEEILRSNGLVRDGAERRLLLDVPADVDRRAHPELDEYLRRGEQPRGDQPPISHRYITSHRRPWWFLGRTHPPPIVVSYMARQAPAFALNPDGLAIINIAHGIYPNEDLSARELASLTAILNRSRQSFRGSGRVYHGGLEKYEPREMEALRIPTPA